MKRMGLGYDIKQNGGRIVCTVLQEYFLMSFDYFLINVSI